MSNVSKIIEQINSEFSVNSDGAAFISIRGAARLADVDATGLSRNLGSGVEQKPSAMAQFLIEQGFMPVDLSGWATNGIPDVALALILEYYAYECQERYRTEQAKRCCRAFRSVGIRTWIQQQLGWKNQTTVPMTQAEMLLVVAQQMVEQERRTKELEARLTQFEQVREEAIADLNTLEPPSVEAEELSTRAKIRRLVADFVVAKGLGYQEVYTRLYREFRDRYRTDLKVRAKNSGKKKPLDVAEELGVLEQLYAVANDLFVG